MNAPLPLPALDDIRAHEDEMVAIRRRIHAQPELAFEERATSDLVAQCLQRWGYDVHRGLGVTGVVGTLKAGTGTRRIGLRADMDALPIAEATGKPWASQVLGKMHACGHDGHTAMLLAAARHLAATQRFDGIVHLVFQPAEEGLGGAKRMLDDGFLDLFPVEAIFGMHNSPGRPAGRFIAHAGPTMASGDTCIVKIRGTGGHGAMPHRAADPVVAAAGIVLALQTVVARNVDPLQPAVVTVGALHAGKANNVIPAAATLELSVRALDRDVRALLERRIRALVAAQAESYGVAARIDWRPGYAVLVNSPAETEFARRVATELVGADNVTPQGPPLTGSEDFAFMLERVPGSYVLIGNGAGEDGGGDGVGACMVHNPGYDFNDRNIAVGSAYWVLLAERFLEAPARGAANLDAACSAAPTEALATTP